MLTLKTQWPKKKKRFPISFLSLRQPSQVTPWAATLALHKVAFSFAKCLLKGFIKDRIAGCICWANAGGSFLRSFLRQTESRVVWNTTIRQTSKCFVFFPPISYFFLFDAVRFLSYVIHKALMTVDELAACQSGCLWEWFDCVSV